MKPSPVRTLVVDDEPVARAGLRRMLVDHAWLACLPDAVNGPSAIEAIDALRPELVFLDVAMPGASGLEVLQRIRHAPPAVVFTTAYAEHAVSAFELGAIDYLLKPFGEVRLAATLERIRAAFGEPVPGVAERYADAISAGPIARFYVRRGRAIVPVPVEAIVRIEAVGDYVAVHAGGSPELVHVSLARLEARLDPARFARIHRSHLVNLDHVVEYVRHTDGALVARLRDGTELPVARARAQALRGLARGGVSEG